MNPASEMSVAGVRAWNEPVHSEITPAGLQSGCSVNGLAQRSQLLARGCDRLTMERIRCSIDYMIGRLDRSLTISELSAVAGLSAPHFFFVFKRVTGCSPMRFFTQARMQRACELLAHSDYAVKMIARMVGYSDPLYFSRVFASVIGIAPTTYRRERQAQRVGELGLDRSVLRSAAVSQTSRSV